MILEGYARQCIPFLREFKRLGCETTILCDSKFDCGYVSRYADHKIIGVCDVLRSEETEKYVVNLIKSDAYDLVLPMVDFTAGILSKNKTELSKHAVIAVSDYSAYQAANDKLNLMRICMKEKIACPQTLLDLKNFSDVRDQLQFPIVMKPRNGFGARGLKRFDSYEQFQAYCLQNCVDLKSMVIQECLPQDCKQISDNLFLDKNGEIKSSFLYQCHRFYPLKGGTGTLNETFDDVKIHATTANLATLMQMRGCIGVDLMIDPRDGVAKVLEINPRPMACAEIGFRAGVNLAEQILEDAFSDSVKPYMKYQCGIRLRMTQVDILWFLRSPDRFHATPFFLSQKNTHDQMFSWEDPLPWFSFLIGNILKRLNKKKNTRI